MGSPRCDSVGNGFQPRANGTAPEGPEESLSEVCPVPESTPTDRNDVVERFYRELLYELGEFARRPSATAIGAAVVAKRVAKTFGIASADASPLPRFSRAEREDRSENEWRRRQ